jgi:putative Mg2+ transporter-C (MgtC) family protein
VSDLGFQIDVLLEVFLAMFLGGLIGFERELAGKSAGLRTHMMMAASAALLVALGDVLVRRFDAQPGQIVQSDPIRIVEAVVTGVSFLGAGMIFRRDGKTEVEGLTTASGVLLTAGIGICVALEQILLAVGVTLVTMMILRGLVWLERRLTARAKLDGTAPESGHSQPAE